MRSSKLVKLLNTFNKDEFREFGYFVESPFYNREKILIKFYSLLKKHYPEFQESDLKKTSIFLKLYPGKKYNDALLRNAISDLLKLAEEYLKCVHFKKEKFYNKYLLLKELTNRKQSILFRTNLAKAKSEIKTSGIKDEIYYQNVFLLEDEIRRNVVVNSSRILFKDDNLNEQAKNLLIQQLTENIKLYAIMLNQTKFIYDHKFDFSFLELVREYIQNNYRLFQNIPYIKIFYNCVMLFKTGEKKYFDELKIEIKKNYKLLSVTDRKNMFMVLTNHCNSEVKKGKYEFYRENFNIYKELLKTKAYLEGNDFMAHYIYQAITHNALSTGEYEWAEKFIHRYKKILHPDFQETSYHFCLTQLYIKLKDYDSALTSLSKVLPSDINYKLNINIYLLMIYYYRNDNESFYSLIDSFRHFLKRNKNIRKADHLSNNNFTIHIKRLFGLKNRKNLKDKSGLALFKKEIENSSDLNSQRWFLEEINLLMSN